MLFQIKNFKFIDDCIYWLLYWHVNTTIHIIPLCVDKGYTLIIGGKMLSIMLFCAM